MFFSVAWTILRRDLTVAFRGAAAWARAIVFFLLFLAIAALAIGPEPALLQRLGPSLIWLAATFASLTAVDQMFGPDFECGELDLLAAGGTSLVAVGAGKAGAHFCLSVVPFVAASPLVGLMYGLAPDVLASTLVSLLIGGPALSFVCTLAAALSLSARAAGFAATLLTAPLLVPSLIFGVAVAQAGAHAAGSPELKLLAAVTMLFAVVTVPFAGAALRANLE